jgi:adenosylhomocysteine nucleosidase
MTHIGIGHFGSGDMTFHGPVSTGATAATGAGPRSADAGPRSADVGVLTVLPEETQAVVGVLRFQSGYRARRLRSGALAHESLAGQVRVAALQTLTPGPHSAALAHRTMIQEYGPGIVLLVGIAGGISDRVAIGDVVISDEIISYDARRESADGIHRRGQAQAVVASLGHRLNEFFAAGTGLDFPVHRGPIGSGGAVITDADSEIRRWLRGFHEKVLAVETEAAGVAQAFHEEAGARGWLTIRGISDLADVAKSHRHHRMASDHAAATMARLLPFLTGL